MKNIAYNIILITLISIFVPIGLNAHSSWEKHAEDIMGVLGFEYDGRKAPQNAQLKENWIKFISSEMIDKTDFHKKLSENHSGFPNLGNGHRHRVLFHWAYDAEPWNNEFERIVKEYCDIYELNIESNIRIFKSELRQEQKRRNGEINRVTGSLFKFADAGKDREFIRFFASMAYNVHILGDYTSDNTVLLGLNDFSDLIGKIIKQLRDIDLKESKQIIKDINMVMGLSLDNQKKADKLMILLKNQVPTILRNAREGTIYRRVKNCGYKFKEDLR